MFFGEGGFGNSWGSCTRIFLVFGLIYLFTTSSVKVRYYRRITTFALGVCLASICGILEIPYYFLKDGKKCTLRTNHSSGTFLKHFCRIVLGMRVEIKNEEILRDTDDRLLMINHQSFVDLLVVSALSVPGTITLCKKELRWVPIFGWMLALGRNIFIDRRSGARSHDVLDSVSENYKGCDCTVIVFPEGTRSNQRNKTILPLKKGGFHLAINFKRNIIPIVASTYYPKHDPDNYKFEIKTINLHGIYYLPSILTLKVLPPISCKDLNRDDVGRLLKNVSIKMSEVLKSLDTE